MRLIAALLLLSLPAAAEEAVTVFAAASLRTAMDEIAPGFEAATGHELTVSLAGSSALARQIQQGAPADVFLSANRDWMDVLEREGLIDADTRRGLLGNRLVLVAHDPQARTVDLRRVDFQELLDGGRLAMALVEAVPAGIYGKAALQSLGQWDAVAPRVAQADNVRAALALVSLGEAPYGIVYATDARADPGVTVVATFAQDSHPPIVYPVAAMRGAGPGTQAFLDHLQSPEARAVFTAQGFTLRAE
jgi:molybdate transport system substrate-binding protein